MPKPVNQKDLTENKWELPYIQHEIPSELRKTSPFRRGIEGTIDSFAEMDKRERSLKLVLYPTIFLLILFIIFYSMPPFKATYQGDLGTYHIYHYKKEITTPSGAVYDYRRQAWTDIIHFTVTCPDGSQLSMNNLHVAKAMDTLSSKELEGEERDIYFALISMEDPDSQRVYSVSTSGDSGLAFASFFPTLFACYMFFRPEHIGDMGSFAFIYWSSYFQTPKFEGHCRKFAVVLLLFSLTPWGQEFHFMVFMKTFGKVVGF